MWVEAGVTLSPPSSLPSLISLSLPSLLSPYDALGSSPSSTNWTATRARNRPTTRDRRVDRSAGCTQKARKEMAVHTTIGRMADSEKYSHSRCTATVMVMSTTPMSSPNRGGAGLPPRAAMAAGELEGARGTGSPGAEAEAWRFVIMALEKREE